MHTHTPHIRKLFLLPYLTPLATLMDDDIRLTSEFHQSLQPGSSESYSDWLLDWMSHISTTSTAVLVPPEAANITTPLNYSRWQLYLSDHPDAVLTEFFITEITQRFRLGFSGTLFTETNTQKFGWCPATPLGGVQVHHRRDHTTQAYRPTDHTTQGYRPTVSVVHISHFGVISKCHTPNK